MQDKQEKMLENAIAIVMAILLAVAFVLCLVGEETLIP